MKKVLVGMSGGVDSSVAAFLLKEQGYIVLGATMVLFDNNSIKTGCLSSTALDDAKKVCDKLGIEHHVIDFRDEFKCHVIDNFIDTYRNGRTPNPCIECNKYLKFGLLWDKAKQLGCDYIATGHYAIVNDGKISKSNNKIKDQSYFLYGIDRDIIKHIIFPLGEFYDKDDVRRIARDNDLFVDKKKDSQDICFIPNGNYREFLNSNVCNLNKTGYFILKDGTVVGKHNGIFNYTIGQRKGLGISYNKPLYVISINSDDNNIILGSEDDLYSNELIATRVNLLVDYFPKEVKAKVRFRGKESRAMLEYISKNEVRVIFDEKQRAVTNGQSIVFYDDNGVLLGGGIIRDNNNF